MNGKTISKSLLLLIVLVCALSAANNVKAQTGGGGSIQGTVTDPTGAVVPGATVVATNVATTVETTRQSNDAGVFVISPLPVGEYKVTASLNGFETLIQEKIIVDALSTVTVNMNLKVGNIDTKVTIEAVPAQINISDPRLGQTVRNELYTQLPLSLGVAVAGSGISQGPRNPGAFIFLLPGVTEGNGTRWGAINGGQGFSKEVFIEGVPITDPIQQGEGRTIALGLSVESVEQFQVETSGTGVEFTGQGSENYTIKSGKNQFHGAGFEYLRNTVLDARGFLPAIRPVEHQNEFGGTFSGPILKKKLFFFFGYDRWIYRVVSPSLTASIPTLKERAGDFSELLALPTPIQIFDPLTTVCSGTPAVCTRTAFAGNIIPANRISAISKVYQSLLPLPTASGLLNNYTAGVPAGLDNTNYNVKVDYDLTSSQRLSGIYTYGKRTQPTAFQVVSTGDAGSILPLPYNNTRIVTEIPTVFQVKHTWTATPNLVNQLSFGFQHLFIPITNATSADKWSTKSGIQGLPPGDAADAFLFATFAGNNNNPTNWRGGNATDFEDNNYNYTVQDSVLLTHGKHSFKFGGQYQRTFDKVKNDDTGTSYGAVFSHNQTANFNANGSVINNNTGNAYASYLLGALSAGTVRDNSVSGVEPTIATFTTYSYWFADDWKVTPRLTLNLGLRHDIMIPYTEKNDKFTFLDITAPNSAAGGILGALRFGGNYAPDAISCHCSQLIHTDYKALGPRVGFAYSLNDKTAIRGGYGIMYTRRGAVGGREGARVGTDFVGLNAQATTQSTLAYEPAYFWQNGVPAHVKGPIYDDTYLTSFSTARANTLIFPQGTLTYPNPDSVPPRYTNWNLSVQRSITPSLVLTAAYVGGLGTSLAGAAPGRWTNQADPRYLALGSLLNSTANATTVAQAAAIIPGIALPYATFNGTISQMLKPYPQYSGVAAPYNNDGMSNYQAMQLSLQQRLQHGLTFNFNYTYSRSKGTVNGFQTAYQSINALSINDEPHVMNAFYSYRLPFGKGDKFDSGNSVVQALAGGWTVSGITRAASGVPLGPFTVACSAGQQGTCYANLNSAYHGDGMINGDWNNGNVKGAVASQTAHIDINAFSALAPYTYGNSTPTGAYGLRQPYFFNQDLAITRNFQVRESVRLVFGLDSQNLFNNVRLGGISTNLATLTTCAAGSTTCIPGTSVSSNAAFGKPTSQINLPRAFQFKFRLEF